MKIGDRVETEDGSGSVEVVEVVENPEGRVTRYGIRFDVMPKWHYSDGGEDEPLLYYFEHEVKKIER